MFCLIVMSWLDCNRVVLILLNLFKETADFYIDFCGFLITLKSFRYRFLEFIHVDYLLLRYVGECVTVNMSHIVHADGTAQARCNSDCTGEVLLSVGLTVLIGGTVVVAIKRLARYD